MERLDHDPPILITRKQKIRNILNNERLKKAEERLRNDGYTPMQFLRVSRLTFTSSNRKYFKQLQQSIEEDPILGGDIVSDEEDEVNHENQNEILLQPTQPTPAPEPPKCSVCLVGPLNAVWMCGHFLCVDCAEHIKNNQSRVLRKCHLCRKKATSYIKCFHP